MSIQVTLTLPDDIYQRAESLARLTGRPIADVLAERLQFSLDEPDVQPLTSIEALSDAEVLALANLQMEKRQDKRLSYLLQKQQNSKLGFAERHELSGLMREYEIGLLHKSQGLAEAVRRGLMSPLEP